MNNLYIITLIIIIVLLLVGNYFRFVQLAKDPMKNNVITRISIILALVCTGMVVVVADNLLIGLLTVVFVFIMSSITVKIMAAVVAKRNGLIE